MKPRLLLFLCCVLCRTGLLAQPPADEFADGALVQCGSVSAVIFDGMQSPDEHFAVGWTLRPNRKKAPVDWSAYVPGHPEAMYAQYPTAFTDPAQGDYVFVDGILDLRAKTFISLPTDDPYYPHNSDDALNVVWSEARGGPSYAVVGRDLRWYTYNLWLVAVGPGGVHVTDLRPAADQAAARYMHKRNPKDADQYVFTYQLDDPVGNGRASHPAFQGNRVSVSLLAQIPHQLDDAIDSGVLTFALPKGNVTRAAFK